MIRRYSVLAGLLFVSLFLATSHSYVVLADASSHEAHNGHSRSEGCKTVCQIAHKQDRNKLTKTKLKRVFPSPHSLIASLTVPIVAESDLVKDSRVWRQSSWLPPDTVLLSGYYTSGL